MPTRRRFLQTLAAAPTVAAVPMLWAMDIPEPPERFDGAEYSCGLIWVETDFSVYIHKATYSWHQWDWAEKKLVRMDFVQREFGLAGQNEFISPDPKFCVPFTARNGRGYLNITYNDGHRKTAITHTRKWALNDLNKVDENKAYHRRLVVA